MAAMTAHANKFASTPDDAELRRVQHDDTVRGAIKLLRVVFDSVRRHSEYVETTHGITSAQLWLLWELARSPGLRAVDLAKTMAVHRASADLMLQELSARGLVRILSANGTAASTCYALSPEGQRIADASPDFGQGVLKSSLDPLPDRTLNQLVEGLKAMTAGVPFRDEHASLCPISTLLRQPARPEVRIGPAGEMRASGSDKSPVHPPHLSSAASGSPALPRS